jgi:hypothetical protein
VQDLTDDAPALVDARLRRLALLRREQVSSQLTFGTGYSGGSLYKREVTLFAHKITPTGGRIGVMTHFWTTAPAALLVRSTAATMPTLWWLPCGTVIC